MSELSIGVYHIDDEIGDEKVRGLVQRVATTKTNEYPTGAIVVALQDNDPIAAVAVGKDSHCDRFAEIRNIETATTDSEVVTRALGKIARAAKSRAALFFDGLQPAPGLDKKLPEGVDINSTGLGAVAFDGTTVAEMQRITTSRSA